MQCHFNKHLRCRNTYHVDGEEKNSCWSENKLFLELLAEYFYDDGVCCIPFEHQEQGGFRRPNYTLQIKHAEIYAWFNDELSPDENNIAVLEPWIKSGALKMSAERLAAITDINIYMNHIICRVLQVAEWRYLDNGYKLRGK